MKRVCVYCGSSPGSMPDYMQAASDLGKALVKRKMDLVYGGASVGTMGEIARTVLAAGGDVTGVMPKGLVEKEIAFKGLTDLRVVDDMHQRKSLMNQISDGFIAMPGGLGTLEEIFEALTWAQLGLHEKPCGLLNVCGYYDKLVEFLDHGVEQGFVKTEYRGMIQVDECPERLLDKLERRPHVG